MRRIAISLCLILLLPTVIAEPDSTVEISYERKIANFDIGINGGAISPQKESILLFGADGFAHVVSANGAANQDYDISLENETTAELNAASWHPAGKSALIVGDSGVVLRYNSTTHALSEAEGSFAIAGNNLQAISFTPGSSVAYIGTEDGNIWKYYADTFTMIDDSATSSISDLTCMKNENICLVSTLNDGIAVIDQADEITWIANTRSHTWIGISCDDPLMTACTGFASGKKTSEIDVDTLDASESKLVNVTVIEKLEGDFVKVDGGSEASSIIGVGPISMVRYTQYSMETYLMFSNTDAANEDVFLGGDSYAYAWENSKNSGFLITSYGRVVSFEPSSESTAGFVPGIVIFLIALSVPGVFLGMIYWNSPYLQRKYAELFGRKKGNEK